MVPTSPLGKIMGSCAMLVGVLVIAFPVSVFSELWSKELKANGAYRSIANNSTQKDFDEMEDSFDERAPPKYISAVFDKSHINEDKDVKNDDTSTGSLVFQPHNSPSRSDAKTDMTSAQAIRHYMAVIDDAQQKIRNILEKLEDPETSST
jgi:hypothetical protein